MRTSAPDAGQSERHAGRPHEGATGPPDLITTLTSRGYHVALFVAGLVGVPIGLIAFGFLPLVSKCETWLWRSLPADAGWSEPPGWYALLMLGFAGLLVGLVVARLPGRGGHLPVKASAATRHVRLICPASPSPRSPAWCSARWSARKDR